MTDIAPLVPRQPVPPLAVALAGGGKFDLATESPDKFILVVFYRGLHCPLCRRQLGDLEAQAAGIRQARRLGGGDLRRRVPSAPSAPKRNGACPICASATACL